MALVWGGQLATIHLSWVVIYAHDSWCDNFIIFCPAISDILQHIDRQQSRYEKHEFRESF